MRSKGAAGDFLKLFQSPAMFLFHFQRNVIDFFTPKRRRFFSYSQISAWENIFPQLPQISTWEKIFSQGKVEKNNTGYLLPSFSHIAVDQQPCSLASVAGSVTAKHTFFRIKMNIREEKTKNKIRFFPFFFSENEKSMLRSGMFSRG